MPLSPMHKKQRAKNLTVMLILLALMAMFFAITMIRLGSAS
jgi:hypothetical protein